MFWNLKKNQLQNANSKGTFEQLGWKKKIHSKKPAIFLQLNNDFNSASLPTINIQTPMNGEWLVLAYSSTYAIPAIYTSLMNHLSYFWILIVLWTWNCNAYLHNTFGKSYYFLIVQLKPLELHAYIPSSIQEHESFQRLNFQIQQSPLICGFAFCGFSCP